MKCMVTSKEKQNHHELIIVLNLGSRKDRHTYHKLKWALFVEARQFLATVIVSHYDSNSENMLS